ncbi:hypothetical protein GCM10023322_36200 [Rugosimonospora acidiphila]|uniref:Uncharacterized protein n=1 Tax=Rugosimonospora acidiphila TaxID=556531 RepID=A0ABP9RVG4_9ACTN
MRNRPNALRCGEYRSARVGSGSLGRLHPAGRPRPGPRGSREDGRGDDDRGDDDRGDDDRGDGERSDDERSAGRRSPPNLYSRTGKLPRDGRWAIGDGSSRPRRP